MLVHIRRSRFMYLVPLTVALSCCASDSGDSKQAKQSPTPTASTGSAAAADDLLWEGVSLGRRIRWTTQDLTAALADPLPNASFSLAGELRRSFEAKAVEPSNPCVTESKVVVLSVVGSIVSYLETRTSHCEREAHPSGETRITSLDLAGLGAPEASGGRAKPIKLTDLFSEGSVFAALRKDSVVREALERTDDAPTTLGALVRALSSSPPVLDDKRCYAFPDDLLARFAFHHLEQNMVAVRIGIPGAAPCRENLTMLGILLPVPSSLADALNAAASKGQGFLMQDAPESAHGRQTVVTFSSSSSR